MAEWVQKGNLKGPQGDPGQDAQLPAGGTEGQVLTKTADGEAWQDVPEPDMTEVVKIAPSGLLEHDGQVISQIHVSGSSTADTIIGSGGPGSAIITAMGQYAAQVVASNGSDIAALLVTTAGPSLKMGSKSVTSITDDASTGSADALATAKAVKDYVDDHAMPSVVPISKGGTGATTAEGAALMVFEHAPEASPTQAGVVKTLSDEDFCAYMGMEYDPADWS